MEDTQPCVIKDDVNIAEPMGDRQRRKSVRRDDVRQVCYCAALISVGAAQNAAQNGGGIGRSKAAMLPAMGTVAMRSSTEREVSDDRNQLNLLQDELRRCRIEFCN